MKDLKYFTFLLFAIASITVASGQVLINKIIPSSNSVALEFDDEFRGILLEPITLPLSPSAGTIAFDDTTGSFRTYNGSSWSAVTSGGTTNTIPDYTTSDLVIINAQESTANGILIIEDNEKAMVLPVVTSGEFNIKSPATGLLYYDVTLKTVMVFNGNSWVAY